MKLLITGGCGFLGSNLADAGIQRGDDVVLFDNQSRLGADDNLAWLRGRGRVHHVRGDVRDVRAVESVIRETAPDTIFHLAGQVAMTTSLADPRQDFETNALGSLNVLEAVRAHAPKALIIYSSTNKVYGDLEQFTYRESETRWVAPERPLGFDETTPLNFHSPYGCSKGAADQYMRDYARMYGLSTVVFRHSSMYGGRQFATSDQGWIGWFCEQARLQSENPDAKIFTISGNGKQVRDVLHAHDMVALYFAAANAPERVRGRAFNVGGGMANSLSLLELFVELELLTGCHLRYSHLPPRSSDQRVFVADTSAIREALGWNPVVDVRSGLANMMTWIRKRA